MSYYVYFVINGDTHGRRFAAEEAAVNFLTMQEELDRVAWIEEV